MAGAFRDRVSGLYKGSFWLDGGYDLNLVAACSHHPDHDWWVFALGEEIDPRYLGSRDPDELMVVCRECLVPRCGHTTDDNPCMLHRHHDGAHDYARPVPDPKETGE